MKLSPFFERLTSRAAVKRLVEDKRHRAVVLASFGLAFNLLYAAYNAVLAYLVGAYWFYATCIYHTLFAVIRFCIVLNERRLGIKKEYTVARTTGVLLLLCGTVLPSVVYASVTQDIAKKYGEIVMITIAAYTFFKLAMAIVRAVKWRGADAPLLWAICSMGYAEVAVSVFTMQTSMLVSFGEMADEKKLVLNLFTGICVCLFIFVLGIILVKKAKRSK